MRKDKQRIAKLRRKQLHDRYQGYRLLDSLVLPDQIGEAPLVIDKKSSPRGREDD